MKRSIYPTKEESKAARHMAELIAIAHEVRDEPREAAAVRKFADGMTGMTRKDIDQPPPRSFYQALALTKKGEPK